MRNLTDEVLQVDGLPVTTEEMQMATAIMAAFNEANGSSYQLLTTTGKPTNELRILLARVRETPELEIADHRRIIAVNFEYPWWTEFKAGSVAAIYGDRTWSRCRAKGEYEEEPPEPEDENYGWAETEENRRLDDEEAELEARIEKIREARAALVDRWRKEHPSGEELPF